MDKNPIMVKIAIILALMLLLAGCSTKLADFTLLTTKNADFSRMSEFRKGSQPAEGANTLFIILFFPATNQPPMKAAVDEAIASVPGCVALADGAIYLQNYYWLLAAGAVRYVVEGTPVIDPQLKVELPSRYILVAYDETKQKYVPQYLSRDKYNKVKTELLAGADKRRNF